MSTLHKRGHRPPQVERACGREAWLTAWQFERDGMNLTMFPAAAKLAASCQVARCAPEPLLVARIARAARANVIRYDRCLVREPEWELWS